MYVEASDGSGGGINSETYTITSPSSQYLNIQDSDFLGKTVWTDFFVGIKEVKIKVTTSYSKSFEVKPSGTYISDGTDTLTVKVDGYKDWAKVSFAGYFT